MQGRVRVYLGCSLDGFIAGPDDDLSWLAPPEGEHPAPDPAGITFEGFLAGVGAMIMGRRTHDVIAGFDGWHYGDIPVLVPTHRPLTPAAPTVQAVCGPIEQLVAQARAIAKDRDVYLDGGDVVRQALDAGLVDELVLTFVPKLIGQGVRLFDGLLHRRSLVFEAHRDFGPGMVQVVARVVG